MTNPLYTIERTVAVGIWDNCNDVLRVYNDKTISHTHYVQWRINSGSLAVARERITGRQHEQIKAALADGCDSTAWRLVEDAP